MDTSHQVADQIKLLRSEIRAALAVNPRAEDTIHGETVAGRVEKIEALLERAEGHLKTISTCSVIGVAFFFITLLSRCS